MDRLDKTLISASPRLRNRMPVWRSVLAADVGSSEKRSPPHLRPCARRPFGANYEVTGAAGSIWALYEWATIHPERCRWFPQPVSRAFQGRGGQTPISPDKTFLQFQP